MSHRPSVLIVGSGLAGLTTAVMLAWRGVFVCLVERHAGTSRHPRARSVNFRSMELLRVAGLEPDLAAAGGQSFADFRIVIAESVTGRELQTLLPPGGAMFDANALSPARPSTAGQDRVEPILRRHAEALGAELRYSTELVSFEQDRHGVSARIRGLAGGREETVRADYLVAADGHRSPVRERLGIAVHGHGTLSSNIGILFEGDVQGVIGHRAMALYYLQNPTFTGAFVNTDDAGRALVSVEYDPRLDSIDRFDTNRCVGIVRAALGVPDFEARIIEVLPWEMSSRVADEFSRGRVFLAGDAAHTMPPTGGLGGQTAIQDGYDLAWKLAMVLHGDAGPALLDTYASERKPVAEITVARQTANYVERMRPDLGHLKRGPVQGAESLDYMSVAMGYRYRSAAISPDPRDDLSPVESPFTPSGRPGTRAAHIPLLHRGARISLLDLIGRDFVLICGACADGWARAARTLAFDADVPVSVYRIGADVHDIDAQAQDRLGLEPSSALLLRPDGYIAWRSPDAREADSEMMAEALARALCRAPETLRRRGVARPEASPPAVHP